jgi:hypothetical protein
MTRTVPDPANRQEHIDQLLGLIHEATLMLRSLMNEAEGVSDQAQQPAPSPENPLPRGGAPVPRVVVGGQDMLALFGEHQAGAGDPDLAEWERGARSRVRERFASIGHVGAGVFLRLLRSPGEFVTQEELMRAAGVRSGSRRVIKVYICRLRHALAKHDMSPDAIETGWRSYRLHADAVPGLLRLLTDA